MKRRELREHTFMLLFRVEFNKAEEMEEQKELYLESVEPLNGNDRTFMEDRFYKISEHLAEIDVTINEVAKGWKTKRMGKVELTILRLAVFEMKYDEDVPVGVAINEAVELAKKFGGDESPSFVNGILAKLAPPKTPAPEKQESEAVPVNADGTDVLK